MQHIRAAKRFVLIATTLLSACGASGVTSSASTVPNTPVGDFLAGRFAMATGDYAMAATNLLRASDQDPKNQELALQAFIACIDAGRPEAVRLARRLPDSQVAQLVLADVDAKAGHWQGAEQRFRSLPRQGMTQLLQPLLVAWAQLGGGHVDSALSTLRPYIDNPRFQGLFALHGGMIADIGGRSDEAARLYRLAQGDLREPNLRLAQILASWQARSGQAVEAQHTLAMLPNVAPDMSIAMPGLLANVTKRPVPNAIDGVAETYFTFAALLRGQEANEFALIMLHLSLDLRPDFTAARVLLADILATEGHPGVALRTLNEVPQNDPIHSVVELRRATLIDRLGRSDEAMRELDRMSQAYPSSPLPDAQRGDILRAKSRFTDAVAAYDKAIARLGTPTANDWLLFYNRGVSEERSHQWGKADADFHTALKLSPDQPFVLNYLGYSYADMGKHLNEAREMIERAAAQRPNDGAITDSLGWVLFREGKKQDAVKTLEHAVELEPEDATINEHLGDAYWAVGRKLEARYQWRRALTLHPAADDVPKLEAKISSGHPGDVISGQ
ncbi:MAG TPA: tetratricopeptide repeat protein [Rhodopila sp.]|uniref:tetratricopeptide repeat protein n=1 Tax=Rhodopila sp. TaxID=2480087 RepID=UPI002CB95501|nr:tetratricopeptide repeat protein [Rhodopila sp.]HVY16532.1 tetratricopeptide repeat protein [Rhodopila sp.]